MNNIYHIKELKKEKIFQTFKKSIPQISGIILGGIAGYLYYTMIDQASSSPITLDLWLSILWGMILGYLFGSVINKKQK